MSIEADQWVCRACGQSNKVNWRICPACEANVEGRTREELSPPAAARPEGVVTGLLTMVVLGVLSVLVALNFSTITSSVSALFS